MTTTATKRRVKLKCLLLSFLSLHRGAMVDEVDDGQPVCELGGTTHVVAVEVADDQIVYLGDSGIPGSGDDPVGITSSETGPSGVDQHGLARR